MSGSFQISVQLPLLASNPEPPIELDPQNRPEPNIEPASTSAQPLWLRLYYGFVFYCCLSCSILLLTSIINLISNILSSSNEDSMILCSSILGNTLADIKFQAIFNFLTILILMVAHQWFQHKQAGLRRRYNIEDTVAKHIVIVEPRFITDLTDAKVDRRILGFSSNSLIAKRFYMPMIEEDIISNLRLISLNKLHGDDHVTIVNETDQNLMRYMTDRQIQNRVAFVIFKKLETVNKLMHKNKKSSTAEICANVASIFKEMLGNEANEMMLMRCPEPEDILFENFGLGLQKILYKSWLRFSLTLIIMVSVMSYVILFLNYLGANITLTSKWNSWLILAWIFITDQLLMVFIEDFTILEKPRSFTMFATVVALKLTIALAFNTVVVMFIIQYLLLKSAEGNIGVDWNTVNERWMDQMFYMTLINASAIVLSPLIKWVKYKYKDSRFFNCRKESTSAEEARKRLLKEATREYYRLPIELAKHYANIMNTMMMTALFAPFLPIMVLISLAGLIVCYMIDKSNYSFARNVNPPCRVGMALSKMMNRLMKWFVVHFAVGNLIVGIEFFGDGYMLALPVMGLALSVLHFLLPGKRVRNCLITEGRKDTEEDGLEKVLNNEMIEAYMRKIPVYYDTEEVNEDGRMVQKVRRIVNTILSRN